jgi:hypothetical protein
VIAVRAAGAGLRSFSPALPFGAVSPDGAGSTRDVAHRRLVAPVASGG